MQKQMKIFSSRIKVTKPTLVGLSVYSVHLGLGLATMAEERWRFLGLSDLLLGFLLVYALLIMALSYGFVISRWYYRYRRNRRARNQSKILQIPKHHPFEWIDDTQNNVIDTR